MASSSNTRKLRLLCLHGFRTSGAIMKQQLEKAKWIEVINDLVELVYMNAHFVATGPSDMGDIFPPPYFEWYQANKNFSEVYGIDESVDHLTKIMNEEGPFDGFLAFSQGAILGCAMIGLQEKGITFVDAPKIGMVVVLGGACSQALKLKPAYYDPILCPSIHFIGQADKTQKKAQKLASCFKEAIVVTHTRGRVVPVLDQKQAQSLRAFLSQQLAKRGHRPK